MLSLAWLALFAWGDVPPTPCRVPAFVVEVEPADEPRRTSKPCQRQSRTKSSSRDPNTQTSRRPEVRGSRRRGQ